MPYWFNVDTGQVETDDNRSQDANVMGPYDIARRGGERVAARP